MKRSGFKNPGKGLSRKTPLRTKTPMKRGESTLKASKPMERSNKPIQVVGQRGKRMRQGKVAPTAQEQDWMYRAANFGCIVCFKQTGVATSAEIHHLKSGDRRMGHLHSIGLCYWHHRGGDKDGPYISRHPWKARFEAAYGSELDLLEELRALLGA